MILTKHLLLSTLIALSNAQSNNVSQQSINIDDAAEYIKLMPPINTMLTMEKKQVHYLNDKMIVRTYIKNIIFQPTKDKNILGYDINVELIDIQTKGDEKLAKLLTKTNQKIGTTSYFSYDIANNILTLNNSDESWQNFLMNIEQIQKNVGKRNEAEKIADKKFLERIKKIPEKSRNALLTEDISIILSFIGKKRTNSAYKITGKDIVVIENNERQNGQILEQSHYHISQNSGLIEMFNRIVKPKNNEQRKITTNITITAQ